MKRSREPDLRFLCERCGYHLKGLLRSDVCPECGTPVVESLPEKRIGTRWQQRPGIRSWWRTMGDLESRSQRTWQRLAVAKGHNGVLIVVNCLVAGCAPFIVFVALSVGLGSLLAAVYNTAILLPIGLGVSAVYLALTIIEGVGIGLISRRRGWRIHQGMRAPILGLASYAWILCTILILIAVLIVLLIGSGKDPWPQVVVGAGALSGLLQFEILVYIGMRKMRFANAPGSEKELAESGDTPLPAAAPPPSPARVEGGE